MTKLNPEDQHRRELLIEAVSIAYTRALAATPWRRRRARRRHVARMGWFRG